jgi:hypothetical protein
MTKSVGEAQIMATVFKKTFTKPLPAGAEVFARKGARGIPPDATGITARRG